MAMLSPKFDYLTIGHDFLFKKVMRNPRICKHRLQRFHIRKSKRLLMFFMTAVVYVLMLSSLTKSIRITTWKCR